MANNPWAEKLAAYMAPQQLTPSELDALNMYILDREQKEMYARNNEIRDGHEFSTDDSDDHDSIVSYEPIPETLNDINTDVIAAYVRQETVVKNTARLQFDGNYAYCWSKNIHDNSYYRRNRSTLFYDEAVADMMPVNLTCHPDEWLEYIRKCLSPEHATNETAQWWRVHPDRHTQNPFVWVSLVIRVPADCYDTPDLPLASVAAAFAAGSRQHAPDGNDVIVQFRVVKLQIDAPECFSLAELSCFRHLLKLFITNCGNIRTIFDDNTGDAVMPHLFLLRINRCATLDQVHTTLPLATMFPALEVLDVFGCANITLRSPAFDVAFPVLSKLYLRDCPVIGGSTGPGQPAAYQVFTPAFCRSPCLNHVTLINLVGLGWVGHIIPDELLLVAVRARPDNPSEFFETGSWAFGNTTTERHWKQEMDAYLRRRLPLASAQYARNQSHLALILAGRRLRAQNAIGYQPPSEVQFMLSEDYLRTLFESRVCIG